MAVTVNFIQELKAEESISLGLDLVSNPTVTHQIGDNGRTSGTLTASTVVPATKAWSDTRTLSAGADALDLTALVFGNLANVTFSGLKVQNIKIKAAATNTSPIVVKPAASNGYNLFGDADGQVTLGAGAEVQVYNPDTLADVGGSAKAVDVTSADVDAIYSIILVAG